MLVKRMQIELPRYLPVVACLVLLPLLASPSFAQDKIKVIKIAVTNPSDSPHPAEDIAIPITDLQKIAPDFNPTCAIVTATNASTVEQDAVTLATAELPSQVDDLDGDFKPDELAFQIDLGPRQTRIVTIAYGDQQRIWRLRSDYPARTDARFTLRFDGLAWESERNAWRIYFDKRNAIDLYGKRRDSLQLWIYAMAGYPYHDESPEGRDIYDVGSSMGIGAVGAWVDGQLVKVSDVQDRKYRIIATGPVRAIVELEYAGWNLDGKRVALKSRMTQWAGERGFTHEISSDAPSSTAFVTGITLKRGLAPVTSGSDPSDGVTWLATWGEQVVVTGANAHQTLPGQNLGLAVLTTAAQTSFLSDAQHHLLRFSLTNQRASWYALAAWDQKGTNRRVGEGNSKEMGDRSSYVLPPDGITTRSAFLAAVRQQAARISHPAQVKIVTQSPGPEPAPPDTLATAPSRSYQQGIELLREHVDRNAAKWAPVISSQSPGQVTTSLGDGFFTEGDNSSGEWHKQQGFAWTGSFWIGELWRLYARTKDEKYHKWAELWSSHMIGQEAAQNHDAGFLYFYSSALGFELTHKVAYRESALRAAARLKELYNPETQLIPAWRPKGDDTIIDTMMNLQILWWASCETHDPEWREIGLQHALRSADWLIRPDGSVIQSVHYNPGGNPQQFSLGGSPSQEHKVSIPNHAAVGEEVFTHTHQGFSADSTWARGAAWALYGFTVAYTETHEPRMLDTAQRVADFISANLPADRVPWYDLDDEGVHFRNRDASAGAIMAGGFLRLSEVAADNARRVKYREEGERITQSLIQHYLTPVGANDATPPGLLRHASSTRPQDGPLIYAQYYLLDALLWLDEHSPNKQASPASH